MIEDYDDQSLADLVERHKGKLGERAQSELNRRARMRNAPGTPSLFGGENIARVEAINEPILRRMRP